MKKDQKKQMNELIIYALQMARDEAALEEANDAQDYYYEARQYVNATLPEFDWDELQANYTESEDHYLAQAQGLLYDQEDALDVYRQAYEASYEKNEAPNQIYEINEERFHRTFRHALARKLAPLPITTHLPFFKSTELRHSADNTPKQTTSDDNSDTESSRKGVK